MFVAVARALADNQLGFAPAAALEESVVLITLQVASGRYSAACQTLFELRQGVSRLQLPPGLQLANELQGAIAAASNRLGCSCSAPAPYGP
jgi:hypothetical protein